MVFGKIKLTAKIEPFDSFWEAPKDVEKGYAAFFKFYKYNYLKYIPENKNARILVVSCGPGYFMNLLAKKGYANALGIDSNLEKVNCAKKKGFNCLREDAFSFLGGTEDRFDVIFCEQEINHLTKEEILAFLKLCWSRLRVNGTLMIHSINGANPITGSEAAARNFDHYNSFTEYSLRQILRYSNFDEIKIIPLNLYVFYANPLNYALILLDSAFSLFFRLSFLLYGKSTRIFTKKIAGICRKSHYSATAA